MWNCHLVGKATRCVIGLGDPPGAPLVIVEKVGVSNFRRFSGLVVYILPAAFLHFSGFLGENFGCIAIISWGFFMFSWLCRSIFLGFWAIFLGFWGMFFQLYRLNFLVFLASVFFSAGGVGGWAGRAVLFLGVPAYWRAFILCALYFLPVAQFVSVR